MTDPATVSERLFRALCRRHRIWCRPVPRATTVTPDYRIRVQGHPTVVEVKQFDPNTEDRQSLRDLKAERMFVRSYKPGRRIAKAIQHGYGQLASLARDRCPGLLIIYNNVPHEPTHTDPMMVRIAMYGQITVPILAPSDPSAQPQFGPAYWGGKKSVSHAHNKALSAVGVLYSTQSGDAGVTLYHNVFAAHPFAPDWLRAPDVRHYTVTDVVRFSEWVEV